MGTAFSLNDNYKNTRKKNCLYFLITTIPAFFHVPILAGWNWVLHLCPMLTAALPGLLTARTSCIEAGSACDGVVVHMEVAIVNHVVAFSVIVWTVDRPEAGVLANRTGLPKAVSWEFTTSSSQRPLNLLDGLSWKKIFILLLASFEYTGYLMHA